MLAEIRNQKIGFIFQKFNLLQEMDKISAVNKGYSYLVIFLIKFLC
jgi:ABC-type lipoprotein export system ATPase subunit